MNKKIIASLLFILYCFTFSCKQGTVNAAKTKDEVAGKTDAQLTSLLPVVQQHSVQIQPASRYKKRSCCVGVPSRFKTNVKNVSEKKL